MIIKTQEENSINERRNQQVMLPFSVGMKIPEEDPVRQASAQLEELDYTQLYRAYSPNGRKSAVEPRILFGVPVRYWYPVT